MKEENCVEKINNADIIEIIAENDSNGSIINAFRDSFRYILLLTVAVASGCISSVEVTKTYVTWESIGEDTHVVQVPPRIEMLLNTTDPQYIDVVVRQICETRKIKRAVEQAIYHEEQETKDLGTEFFVAAITLIPPMTLASPFFIGHGIYIACKATDDETYKDDIRQTQQIKYSNVQDCTKSIPLVLHTSEGIFPLGTTDENGYLRVRIEDVIPRDVLISIINEKVFIDYW